MFASFWRQWLLRQFRSKAANQKNDRKQKRKRSRRLHVETLEDRTVLSTLGIDAQGNLLYQAGPGELSHLLVTQSGDQYTFQEMGGDAIRASGGQIQGDGTSVVTITTPTGLLQSITIEVQDPTDSVTLEGDLSVAGGLTVTAPTIDVSGNIFAGSDVNLVGVNQTTVEKGASILTPGGTINVTSTDATGTTLIYGDLNVSDKDAGHGGGVIEVLGNYVGLLGASIDASGDVGGGTILIGGDYQGQNTAIRNATSTYVDSASTIWADALNSGQGGRVIVWSDEATRYYGQIMARGGVTGGAGGFAEVSSHQYLDYQGSADLQAPHGQVGTLLLDPNDITIQAAGSDTNITGDPNFTTTDDNAILTTATLESALATADVTVTTGTAGANTQQGDIIIADAIVAPAGTHSLTLTALHDIIVNADIDFVTNSSTGSISLDAANNIDLNANISTDGGAIDLSSVSVTLTADVTLSSSGGNIDVTGTIDGDSVLDRSLDLDAGIGDVTITGAVGGTAALQTFTVTSANTATLHDVTTTSGAIDVTATTIDVNGNQTASGGAINLAGAIVLTSDVTLSSSSGNIDVTGTIDGDGVLDRSLDVDAGTGDVTITGAVGGTTPLLAFTVTTANTATLHDVTTTTGDIDVTATTIDANGNLTTSGGAINLAGAIVLTSDVTMSSSGNIGVTGTIDGDGVLDRSLDLDPGTGDVTITGAVGGTTALQALTVTDANNVSFNQPVATIGNVTQNTGTGTTIFNGATIGGNLALTTNAVTIATAAINTTGSVNINAQGQVNMDADLTAGAPITIAANQDGGADSFFQTTGTSITTTDSTLNAVLLTVNTPTSGTGSASLGLISAGSGGTITINANGGVILNNNPGNQNLTFTANDGTLIMTATGGIGSSTALATAVSALLATNTGGGDINIDNNGGTSGLLTINGISNTGGGNIDITNVGDATAGQGIDIAGAVSASGSSAGITISTNSQFNVDANVTADGSISLSSTESTPAAPGDNLSINNAAVVQSTGSNVLIQAGDFVSVSSSTTVSALAGTITLIGGFGDNDGTGGVALAGALNASSTPTVQGVATNNTFTISSAPVNGLNVTGQGTTDSYTVNFGALLGPVNVNDQGTGSTDEITLIGTPNNDHLVVSGTSTTLESQIVNYTGNLAQLNVNGQGGHDYFSVTGSSTLPMFLRGSLVLGNTLNVNAQGLVVTIVANTITPAGLQTITYVNMQTVLITNAAPHFSFPGLTSDQSFVQTMYFEALGRLGSTTELNFWVAQLATIGQGGVANNILRSSEALTRLINQMYVQFLGRTVDPAGLSYWLGLMQAGATEEQVMVGIFSSSEYTTRANTLIGSPNSDNNFVSSLYLLVLQRTPSDSEISYWLGQLPTLGRSGVAMDFVFSSEFRTDAVRTFYGDPTLSPLPFLPFFPDWLQRSGPIPSAQVDFWIASSLDLLSIDIAFASSPEFRP